MNMVPTGGAGAGQAARTAQARPLDSTIDLGFPLLMLVNFFFSIFELPTNGTQPGVDRARELRAFLRTPGRVQDGLGTAGMAAAQGMGFEVGPARPGIVHSDPCWRDGALCAWTALGQL